jgi:hypothetical protein
MSDTTVVIVDDDDEERGIWGRLELIAAIILGVAGILTAYAAFQGALADGDSLDKYTESAKLTSDANSYFSDGRGQQNLDASTFGQYMTLLVTGQEDAAVVLRQRLFSPELESATAEWEVLDIDAADAPPTPLALESYIVPDIGISEEAGCLPDETLGEDEVPACYYSEVAGADAAFAEAQKANEDGDKFELASVFLAIALFLAGIATLFKDRPVKLGMLAGSVILILPGLYAIADGKGWV